MGPLRMVGALSKDKNIEHMISTVEVFIQSLSSLLSVFSGYDGGEFCSGLIFGQTGATMLTNIAQTIVTLTKVGDNKNAHKAALDASETEANHNNNFRDTSAGTKGIKGKIPSARK